MMPVIIPESVKINNNNLKHCPAMLLSHEQALIYCIPTKNSAVSRYLIAIENPEVVVAVETQGHIDTNVISRKNEICLQPFITRYEA